MGHTCIAVNYHRRAEMIKQYFIDSRLIQTENNLRIVGFNRLAQMGQKPTFMDAYSAYSHPCNLHFRSGNLINTIQN